MRDVFSLATAQALPRNELRMLLQFALERDAAWLIAHDNDELAEQQRSAIESLISRRIAGEPIAYLIGEREFYGRAFQCSPAALIPRPETELLVETTLALVPSPWGGGLGRGSPPAHSLPQSNSLSPALPPGGRELRLLDIGTGTGCIAVTLALELPSLNVTAVDVSPAALKLAQINAAHLGANIQFIESNWFTAIAPDARFDLIVSNPPYIVPGDTHLSQGDLRFEPAIALADSVDGLQSYRELANGAMKHLNPGGWLIVEHGYDQGESVPALFRDAGFVDVEMKRDLADLPRVTQARKLT
ncbi:MAG: peptide chain release factor N(5)-glutamine methyltransferase [Betaproteobacteria bacterium]|nr:MAG: peptide chain release factor N(5)-glutamine methyltransferase [Betaproteobacteria bacterium]TAG48839.1 MAG: peptide chain release factor N(5)-glutamine methyltransferase [Betaproteobacteria bacterium]